MKALSILAVMVAILLPFTYAVGYGTSNISLSAGNVSIYRGGNATLGFTVNLTSGNAWGTTVEVANERQLKADGITFSISNAQGIPPYSGTLTATASSNAGYGTYNAVITAAGNDPSEHNATLSISVVRETTTTLPTTTANASPVSTATTTMYQNVTAPSPVTGFPGWGYAAVAVIAIAVAAAAAYLMRGKKAASQRKAK